MKNNWILGPEGNEEPMVLQQLVFNYYFYCTMLIGAVKCKNDLLGGYIGTKFYIFFQLSQNSKFSMF